MYSNESKGKSSPWWAVVLLICFGVLILSMVHNAPDAAFEPQPQSQPEPQRQDWSLWSALGFDTTTVKQVITQAKCDSAPCWKIFTDDGAVWHIDPDSMNVLAGDKIRYESIAPNVSPDSAACWLTDITHGANDKAIGERLDSPKQESSCPAN